MIFLAELHPMQPVISAVIARVERLESERGVGYNQVELASIGEGADFREANDSAGTLWSFAI